MPTETLNALSADCAGLPLTASCKPLKVALLVESTSAGVGRHVIDLAQGLSDLGHIVDLLYSARRIDTRFSKGLIDLTRKGVRTFQIDMLHGLHPSDLLAIWNIRQHLETSGPFDILHCHSTKAGFTGRIAALGVGSRVVYTPHAFVTMSPARDGIFRSLAGWMERGLATMSDAVICVSPHEADHALTLGIPSAALHTVPNGIDISGAQEHISSRSAVRAELKVGDHEICVGFVGRLFAQKAPRLLLEAFALVSRQVDDPIKLVFAGSGPEERSLRQRIHELKFENFVVMAGERDGLQVMSAFDIFALPSLYEGLPYVLLEALSMGLPVISTNVGGATLLVDEGVNGLVVQGSAPGEMADALRRLIVDSKLRLAMGAASKERANQFSLSRMVRQIEEVYRELLS